MKNLTPILNPEHRKLLPTKSNETYQFLKTRYVSLADSKVIGVLLPMLRSTPSWTSRFEVQRYVEKCLLAGFCQSDKDLVACAARYLAGKRKVTKPGTRKAKYQTKQLSRFLSNHPSEVLVVTRKLLSTHPIVRQPPDKYLSMLTGLALKELKIEPYLLRGLLSKEFQLSNQH
jgi:hypothetical protein